MRKKLLAVLVGIGFIVAGSGLADPSPGGGGPFKPCATCRGVTPPPPPAPVTP